MDKLGILRKIMKRSSVDMILISDPFSLRYYTGFRGGEGTAAVTADEAVLAVDSRYTEAAEKESAFPVREFNQTCPLEKILHDVMKGAGASVAGVEDRTMTVSEFHRLKAAFPEIRYWVGLDDALLVPREIKTDQEVETLEHAEEIGDSAFRDICGILKPGMTELEVAMELEYSMKKHGAEGFSFDTIAASGVHSSMPHAIPTEKKLEKGDLLTMDFGCMYQGYCSDMTRTVCIGKAGEAEREIYDIVLGAQLEVLKRLRPGMTGMEGDRIARDYISEKGYGAYFGHGLGHGVGLYIHEMPFLNTREKTVLKPNMIETDEPGIYLPGKFGVRIEDMIVITEDGCRPLAKSPKQLLEI